MCGDRIDEGKRDETRQTALSYAATFIMPITNTGPFISHCTDQLSHSKIAE